MINSEAVVIAYLKQAVEIPVYADAPKDRPGSFLTVELVGGSRDTVVFNRTRLAIQCWDVSRYTASVLAQTVCDALAVGSRQLAMFGVTAVEITNVINFPDLESRQPRYQVTAEVTAVGVG